MRCASFVSSTWLREREVGLGLALELVLLAERVQVADDASLGGQATAEHKQNERQRDSTASAPAQKKRCTAIATKREL